MYGYPADKEYANDCFKLWGISLRYGGPRGYSHEVGFERHIGGRDSSEDARVSIVELVGKVVNSYLTEDERRVVRAHYCPSPDDRLNGELRRCVVSFTIRQLKKQGMKRVYPTKINSLLDDACAKMARVLSYPPAFSVNEHEQYDEKNVCNF